MASILGFVAVNVLAAAGKVGPGGDYARGGVEQQDRVGDLLGPVRSSHGQRYGPGHGRGLTVAKDGADVGVQGVGRGHRDHVARACGCRTSA